MPAIDNSVKTVTTSATKLIDGNPNGKLLSFTNDGLVPVYLGNSSVTSTSYLYTLEAGAWVQFTADFGDPSPTATWYGITASSSASVAVGRVRA